MSKSESIIILTEMVKKLDFATKESVALAVAIHTMYDVMLKESKHEE